MAMRLGTFVRSAANDLGIGKIRSESQIASVIDYFVGPGIPPRTESVPAHSVRSAELDCETRVYWNPDDGVRWRAGRAIAIHGDGYVVRFPNSQQPDIVRESELFTRCDLRLPDPSKFLAARISETPYWQQRRARFVRALVEQRRTCAGLTALLSAGIDLESHQIEVVRRVLQDSVQRYLLADEVGLGKTIEAGVIVRQYVLDNPADHSVLFLVPPHLVRQWEAELQNRFRLGPLLGDTIHVVSHGADLGVYGPVGFVVVDEAHQVAHWVAAGHQERNWFDTLCRMVADPGIRLLLLSATPTLHSNEVGFQALLHLLDPVVYKEGDLAAFRVRLEQQERVAHLYHLFRPDEEGAYLENALDQLVESFPNDVRLAEMAKDLRPLLAYGTDAADPLREEQVRAVRSHVSEAYRLHRRLLRNRRADDRVGGLLPGREGLKLWSYEDPAMAHLAALLEEWRCAASVDAGGAATDYGRLLLIFAQALACDPEVLAGLIDLRIGGARDRPALLSANEVKQVLQVAVFDGEPSILGRLRDAALAVDPKRRLGELVTRLARQFANPNERLTRAVIFASYPTTADNVFAALLDRWPGRVLRHGQEGWQHFCSVPTFRALVCDATAEEGLNLHGPGTMLVHYDLPWSPSRVEQRIGRLDRYGVATKVRSAVLAAAREPYSLACAGYLDCGYRVFERSIAALQHMTASELETLYPTALGDGPDAVHAAAERLGGDEGLVEQALAEIQVLDQLDAVDVPLGHENFSEVLGEADIEQQTEWREAIDDWVTNALHFARRDQGGRDSGVWRYQFRRPAGEGGASTLM
ncbi:MAG: hypothetical protein IT456_23785, partial [Planctomycetes bacterium]|nr:hypothetical protein [Planctomycetota bacterium]